MSWENWCDEVAVWLVRGGAATAGYFAVFGALWLAADSACWLWRKCRGTVADRR